MLNLKVNELRQGDEYNIISNIQFDLKIAMSLGLHFNCHQGYFDSQNNELLQHFLISHLITS